MAKMLNFDKADAGNMKSDMLFLYSSLCQNYFTKKKKSTNWMKQKQTSLGLENAYTV